MAKDELSQRLADPVRRDDYFHKRKAQLWTERSSWDSHAKELAKVLLPRASRFTTSDTNQGNIKHNKIYDSTGVRAARTLAAGMMSGMTSPARPWMKLKHANSDLMKYEPVKWYCAEVSRLILEAFAGSNIYRVLHQGYTETGVFGTHAALIMPHPEKLLWGTAFTFGEYALSTDELGQVNTMYREQAMTAVNMVRSFGYDNCTSGVQRAYDQGALDQKFDVIHAIEPNPDFDPRYMGWRYMPYRSVYFELGGEKGKFLREGGFNRFRGLCPRWAVTGNDVYGESPGMEVLGDVKQLQHQQLRKGQGIDYQTKPPVSLPTSMKGQEVDLSPGGTTYLDSASGGAGQRQMFDVRLDMSHLLADIVDVRDRINAGFFVDLFAMISSLSARPGVRTATEIAELHEEKLLLLGPVLERQQSENIAPLIDMAFDELAAQGKLPPPPEELADEPLEVEMLGVLAQAQRLVQTNTTERFVQSVGNVVAITGRVEAMDKIDTDAITEGLADDMGVDPRFLVDDRQVAKTRQARAQQQAAMADQANRAAEAEIASKVGGIPTQGGTSNAAADMAAGYQAQAPIDPLGAVTGYNSPQAERL